MCANVGSYDLGVPGVHLSPQVNPIPVPDVVSRKRPLEVGDDYGAGHAKRLAKSPEVVFRLLVSSAKIGKVIGKQGAQIRQLREETGAHIKIADAASVNAEDRVIMISSKEEDAVEARSAAEYALVRVATVVIEEHNENNATAKIGPQHQGAPNLTRLLIGRSQAGCLIGKGGSIIKEIRDMTGASVRILAPDLLPFCSCISETDRLVQISGDLFQVQKSLEVIASKLRENPPKEPVTLKSSPYQQQMLYAQAAYSGYGMQQYGNGNGITASMTASYGALDSQVAAAGGIPTIPKVTAEMNVPSSLMGGIIGKGGANITQIRTISGCAVKVFSQKEGATERLITFEGTGEQVSAAQSLVQAFMNAQ